MRAALKLSHLGMAIALATGVALLVWLSGLPLLWLKDAEYSHGPVVLAALAWLVWQRHASLPRADAPALATIAAAVIAALAVGVGALSGINQLELYGAWLFGAVVILALGGWPLLRAALIPLAIIWLVIPLPYGLQVTLTSSLQLLSSAWGAALIRLSGGVVLLQGNTIDMGTVTLLVDEACAGLRYLFPLMVIGALIAYAVSAPAWKKWLIFLFTIPLTLATNSLRIAVTGVLVDRFGSAHADGFLHAFEGWVVFLVAFALLAAFTAAVLTFGKGKPFPQRNRTAAPARPHRREVGSDRGDALAPLAVFGAIALAATVSVLADHREQLPDRRSFEEFPERITDWTAHPQRLAPAVVRVAGATDYYYGEFVRHAEAPINLYVAYYASQRYGAVPHSPAVCIPGDGWVITDQSRVLLADALGKPFEVNRVLTRKGTRTVVAYFWIRQGASDYQNALVAKAALVQSALARGRTDGALVRLLTELGPDEAVSDADARLMAFVAPLRSVLPAFVPD